MTNQVEGNHMNVRMYRHRLLVAVALFISIGITAVQPVRAQVGGASVLFLTIEPDSRAAGMGNSGVGLADNAYAIFWNPAGLAYQRGMEASLTHSNWLPEFQANLYYEYLVGKYHVGGVGTFGAHVTYLHLGENEGRDQFNNPTENFRSYDLAAGLSYGFNVTKNLAVGTGARIIYSNLAKGEGESGDIKPGTTAAFDVGALYRTSPFRLGGVNTTVSAGMNLANMGPKIKYTDSERGGDPIPTNFRFGYSLKFDFDEYNSLAFTNDFTKLLTRTRTDSLDGELVTTSDPFYKAIFTAWRPIKIRSNAQSDPDAEMSTLSVFEQLIIGTGLEYWYNQLFALRTGYFYENPFNGNRQFLTFGAGVRYNIIGVDFSYIYAVEENSPQSDMMRFSLLLNLGK